jgi:DNA-binding NtrC family response regulator
MNNSMTPDSLSLVPQPDEPSFFDHEPTMPGIGGPSIDPSLLTWREAIAPTFIGTAPAFLDVLETIRRVAQTNATILVSGESGTGKEEAALALHKASSRSKRAFVAINCAAIPENLLESELFGHSKGAFTNATGAREGHIVAADGGTLFLDEIGDMPLSAQVKLLRVLQQREVFPVGADRAVPVDIRLVAASNRDLPAMVAAGTFREDLFYRLSVISIHMPALRDRSEDIVALARHFVGIHAQRCSVATPVLSFAAEQALAAHSFRGNVRELGNVIERAVVLCQTGQIERSDLALVLPRPALVVSKVAADEMPRGLHLKSALDQLERRMIDEALRRSEGNRTEAAALLGLNRSTLVEKIRRFG